MRLLNRDGHSDTVAESEYSKWAHIPGETPFETIDADVLTAPELVLEFSSVADGRAFSLAVQLCRARQGEIRLIASGPLIPDQVPLAWASGFSACLIQDEQWERCGEHSWKGSSKREKP